MRSIQVSRRLAPSRCDRSRSSFPISVRPSSSTPLPGRPPWEPDLNAAQASSPTSVENGRQLHRRLRAPGRHRVAMLEGARRWADQCHCHEQQRRTIASLAGGNGFHPLRPRFSITLICTGKKSTLSFSLGSVIIVLHNINH
jgi:hypothetical protein